MSIRIRQTEYAASEATKAPASTTSAKTNAAPDNVFDAASNNATVNEATGDQFVVNTDASEKELAEQKNSINEELNELNESATKTEDKKNVVDAKIENQNNLLEDLNSEVSDIKVANAKLNQALRGDYNKLGNINAQINEIQKTIDANSGVMGTLANCFKGIFGKGVNISELEAKITELEAQKSDIEKSIKEKRAAIERNGGVIEEFEERIERVEDFRDKNIAQSEELTNTLAELQDKIKAGEVTLKEVEDAISNYAQKTGKDLSDEQIRGIAATTSDMLANGKDIETPVDEPVVEGEEAENTSVNLGEMIVDAIESQDTETGEFDAEVFEPAYEEQGFTSEETKQRTEIIEAIAVYKDFGLGIDSETLANTPITQLNTIVESAIAQNIMKTTSTKMIGAANKFASKKDMEKYADSVDEFISGYSALNSYYITNNVEDLETNAYLKLASDKLGKINQGYVYDTAEIGQLTAEAGTLMTTLKTRVSLDEAAGDGANVKFEETRHKTEDAINIAEGKFKEENNETGAFEVYRAEFLELTSKFNNSDSDSAKQVSLMAMNTLYERVIRNDEQPETKDPYRDNITIAA